MAATFPYRAIPPGMPPGVPPPAPVPDYMSEEKLQEKGMLILKINNFWNMVAYVKYNI